MAVGALWNTHHIPGAARHALPFRSVADALAIEHRLHTLVQQGKPLRIVIAGGGISGIEALGEILRRYRDDASLSVELVEAGARLLPGLAASLDADIRRLCEPYAVNFRTATTIASVSAKGVRLADGTRLRSELTLWTAGLAPPALLRESGLARPSPGWADVHQTLQSRHFDNAFVVGDAARCRGPWASRPTTPSTWARSPRPTSSASWPGARSCRSSRAQAGADRVRRPADLSGRGRTVVAGKVLAGAKEGVYQVFMTQMAPRGVLSLLPAVSGRLWQGWRQLALPQLMSLADSGTCPIAWPSGCCRQPTRGARPPTGPLAA